MRKPDLANLSSVACPTIGAVTVARKISHASTFAGLGNPVLGGSRSLSRALWLTTNPSAGRGPGGPRVGGWALSGLVVLSAMVRTCLREFERPMPRWCMRMVFTFERTDAGSRMTATTYFNSLEEFEQLIENGMVDGVEASYARLQGVLASRVA